MSFLEKMENARTTSKTRDLPPLPTCPYMIEDGHLSEVPLETKRREGTTVAQCHAIRAQSRQKDLNGNKMDERLVQGPKYHKMLVPDANGSKEDFNISGSSLDFTVSVDRTPKGLPSSQRLYLRKLQLNTKIAHYKQNGLERKKEVKPIDYNGDEEIETEDHVFNVPYSRSLAFSSNSNLSRQSSSTFGSTRTSIMSNGSFSEPDSSVWSEESEASMRSLNSPESCISKANFSFLEVVDEDLSMEAESLSKLFHQNTSTIVHEENRQRRDAVLRTLNLDDSRPSSHSGFSSKRIQEKTVTFEDKISDRRDNFKPSSKENYLCYTRPHWLPPKESSERNKHRKETQRIISNALNNEAKKQERRARDTLRLEKEKEHASTKIEEIMFHNGLKGWNNNIDIIRNTPDIYYKGMPNKIRSKVWFSQMGNALNLQSSDYHYYLYKVKPLLEARSHPEILEILEYGNNQYNQPRSVSVPYTLQGLDNRHLDISRFKCISVNLLQTVLGFLAYLKEVHLKEPCDGINIDSYKFLYFAGLIELTSTLLEISGDSFKTFTYLCNLFEKDYMRTCLNYKIRKGRISRNHESKLFKDFESIFKRNSNRLFTHFEVIGLKTHEYIPIMIMALFTNTFNFSLSCQLLDIYSFEGEDMISKCLCALFKKVEHKLYGNKNETIDFLKKYQTGGKHYQQTTHNSNFEYDYEFLELIRRMR